jgi:RNA polymerase sigma factor (sigma-70 family)
MPSRSNRDEQLELLIARYGGLIAAIVRKVAGARGNRLHDDIEQQVILALWRRLDGEQVIDHPASYLYRMAVRETIRVLRTELGHQMVPIDAAAPPAAAMENPQRAFEAAETRSAIRASLLALRPDRRRAVNQHLAGRSVSEIMASNGWSYQRARNLIARGLADLRQTLREYRA